MITTSPDAPINLIEVYASRDPTTIGLVWEAATFTGGDVIIDYRVNIAVQGGAFSVLVSGLATPAYTAVGLTSGVIYEFKVESRNSYDFSAYSDVLTLLAAFKPDAPSAPTTTVVTNQVMVSWPDHSTNGSPITAYKVFILEHDGVTYTQETVDCIGTDADVIANRVCYIYLDTLIVAPYSLVLNEEIWAMVIATNVYGDSPYSPPGNDGLIKLIPDAPVNLVNDPTLTSASSIRFTYEEGASNGGLPVIDYSIYYDQGLGTYVLLE
jgi:hypothetical protein